MSDKKIYQPLKEKVDGKFGTLRIEVFYSLGGYNYFSGNYSPRGIYLVCKPVNVSTGPYFLEESVLLSGNQKTEGFKILLEKLNRKSQKKIDTHFEKISPLANKIAELYESDNFSSIKELVASEVEPSPPAPAPETKPSMKLLTKEILSRFEKIGSQESSKDPIVVAKFFNPCGSGTWYATEYNPENKTFFGYVSLFGDYNDEWGYFMLSELESVKGPFGLGIERDRHCGEKPISEFNVPSLQLVK